jgi:hypothetical protein
MGQARGALYNLCRHAVTRINIGDSQCPLASPRQGAYCSDDARGNARVATEYRWAHEAGAHGMARPEALEGERYVRVRQHPFWPASWLMRREVGA